MADKTYPMTSEGKKKLEDELERLKTVERPKVVQRIKVARGFGDLSENSEYSAAKDEQATLETRIVQVQTMLHYAEIIDSNEVPQDEVSLGKKVTFVEDGDDEEETYEIVGEAEADAFNGKISNDSPIVQGLIGKKVGDEVSIATPGGSMKVKIVKVEG
ncbi:transcription elongation factor GreA [Lacticaseibacillus camelliae]|uniref:Transcription elongation factor GreA n=1 Tax=Lacticaseibacillus camelliae DSM 22697 = JCM 13995 TaxID=1423730 RepID=A0A0R2F9P8_9LACO|nr:transcription elongation factor GreA [Lacticaseibacillus camelliae]KRN24814.1 transcription elongation factor [Lacticaseibacillus camelliae DSM 22697 = JCM 13995]